MKKKLQNLLTIAKRSGKAWLKSDPFRQAAVIGYFAIFSIPALLVLVLNIASVFMEKKRLTGEVIAHIRSSINPKTAAQVESAIAQAGELEGGFVSTAIGIIIILFGATSVLVQLQKTLNKIWGVSSTRKAVFSMLLKQLFSLGLILALGFILVISMVTSTAITIAGNWVEKVFFEELLILLHIFEFLFSFALLCALFALIFRYMPNVRPTWRDVTVGSIVTTSLMLALKYVIGIYFAKAEPGSVYGSAGSVVLVMLWVALSSMAVFLGAEFTKQYAEFYNHEVRFLEHTRKFSTADEWT